MAQVQETIRTTTTDEPTTVVREPGHRSNVAARIVSLIGFIIFALLALRFLLSLLGANRNNGFADFVYTASYPLVAPFFGLFNYDPQFGVARFEFETLIAALFWAIVLGIIARLVTVNRHDRV